VSTPVGVETFGNQPTATITSGGTTTGSTAFTASPISSASWPAASASAVPPTFFRIVDVANTSEIMIVTAAPGGSSSGQSWTVTRGAEGTTAIAHASNWVAAQIMSAGTLENFKQATGVTATADLSNSTAETVLATFQPQPSDVAAGSMWDIVYYGTYQVVHGGARPTLTFRLRWGGLSGTILTSMVTGTGAPAFLTTPTTSAQSFDLNANINLLSATSAAAQINFWYQNAASLSTTASNALVSSGTGVTISGNGPLVLTAQWSSASASNALTGVACTYRSS
jgi:hypothetical protein